MGQYYTPIIKNEKGEFKGYYSHDYGSGLKLMEHSYIGNQFVETVIKEMLYKEINLAWVGDYAEPTDIKNILAEKFINYERELQTKDCEHPHKVNEMENSYLLYFINLDKKEYISIREYVEFVKCDNFGLKIHPIPLLTAIGNGKGGGDYWGSKQEIIGSWACDKIYTDSWLPSEYENFKNITKELNFKEVE